MQEAGVAAADLDKAAASGLGVGAVHADRRSAGGGVVATMKGQQRLAAVRCFLLEGRFPGGPYPAFIYRRTGHDQSGTGMCSAGQLAAVPDGETGRRSRGYRRDGEGRIPGKISLFQRLLDIEAALAGRELEQQQPPAGLPGPGDVGLLIAIEQSE